MKPFVVLCSVTLFLLPISIYSQIEIRGLVSGSNGEPIFYATITLLNKSDSTIVSYDLTNDKGEYTIKADKKGIYIVRANCLGYETQNKYIEIQGQDITDIDFELNVSHVSLEEVVVQGRKTGIQHLKDTVSYDPKVFKDGTEKNLGDVLNKLPGIQVDDKGNIRAQGKRVDKVLLNGQDFFGSNTQIATQNLSADIADKVNVLNNYSEYSLLGGFQSGEQTVINVDVDRKWYGKLSGELNTSGGIEDKYDVKGNLININAKSMLSLLFSQNNTGNEVFNMEDYFRIQGGLNEILDSDSNGKFELSGEEVRMLMPVNNIGSRTNGLLAVNYTYQPNDNLKLHSYVLTNRNKEKARDYSKYSYYLTDNSVFNSIEDINRENCSHLYNAFFKIDYSINKSLSMLYKGSLSYSNNEQNNGILNQIDNEQFFSSEMRKNEPFKLSNSLALIKSFEKHLFMMEFNFNYSRSPLDFYLETDSVLFPDISGNMDTESYQINQECRDRIFTGKLSTSFLYRVDKSNFIRTKLGYTIISQKYFTKTNPQTTDYLNDLSLNESDYGLFVDWNKNRGLLQFKIGLSANIYTFDKNTGIKKENLFRLNPYMDLSFIFTEKHKLNLSFKKDIKSNQLPLFITRNVIRDYRTCEGKSLFDKLYYSDYNTNLIYNYFEVYSNTMLVIYANYNNKRNGNTKNIVQKNSFQYWENVASPSIETFYANLTLSKRLGSIPWTIDIKGSYLKNKYDNYISSNENKIKTDTWLAALNLRSKYKFALNTELIYKIEAIKSNPFLSDKVSQYTQTCGLKIICKPTNKLLMDIEYKYIFDHSSAGEKQYLHIIRGNISYRLNKDIDISLTGNNILNLSRLNWNSLYFENNYTVEKKFQQIPGNIMLCIKYKI
jgi:hypothetical protein